MKKISWKEKKFNINHRWVHQNPVGKSYRHANWTTSGHRFKPLWGQKSDSGLERGCTISRSIYGHFPLWKTLWKLMELFTVAVLFCTVRDGGQTWVGSVFRVWKGVSMLLTTALLMYIYTACWLNNYVAQLCPFWCNSYGARLSRLLTARNQW